MTTTFHTGQLCGVLGPNGAGKTTLVRTLAGVIEPTSGSVVVQDLERNTAIDPEDRPRHVVYLPQNGPVAWPMLVEHIVALGRHPHRGRPGWTPAEDDAAVREAMAQTDVTQFIGRTMNQLSGGERARVLLARALAGRPAALLVDEPLAGLDPCHQLEAMDTFRRLAQEGRLIVIVLHDLTLAARYCDRVLVVHHAGIVGDGEPATVLTENLLTTVYGVRAAFVRSEGQLWIVPESRLRP